MFTIILPGSIISDLNNNTVNQSNVAIIDNREFVTKATRHSLRRLVRRL
nr:hypothetical protein [Mycoplasmopsis bovis]